MPISAFLKGSRAIFGALLVLAAAACSSSRGGPIPYDDAGTFRAPDAPSVATLESGYRISPMDTVSVKVFRMPDLSGDYQVDLTGQISLPLIGEVRAVDMTTAQLDETLTRKFGEKYLENPDISVGIKESARRAITVDGAVKNAGAFPATGDITLMQAVALAGGVTETANAHRVAVFRTIDGQRKAAAFDLADIRRGQGTDPKIYPGDVIVVDGDGVKAAYRQILNTFSVFSVFRPF
ncbi:polysaccharide biosynthesis/export family protein [Sphingomonas daechungensis]|uniref:polysaccharide biosynthesis/export family protein n=1 Tax=Sphingomonas daechungensis TaxID=1176646 RepID=UPI0037837CC9